MVENTKILTRDATANPLTGSQHDQNLKALTSVTEPRTSDYTILVTDQGKLIELNGTNIICTLPTRATLVSQTNTESFKISIKNINLTSATINATLTDTIDSAASINLPQYATVTLQYSSDTTTWSIIGKSILTTLEENKLSGITNGTAKANKAVILDSNKDIRGIRNIRGIENITFGTGSNVKTLTETLVSKLITPVADICVNKSFADKINSGSNTLIDNFATNTTLVFYNSTCPTGYTRINDITSNGYALRVVTTGDGGTFTGTNDIFSVGALTSHHHTFKIDRNNPSDSSENRNTLPHALSAGELPGHEHQLWGANSNVYNAGHSDTELSFFTKSHLYGSTVFRTLGNDYSPWGTLTGKAAEAKCKLFDNHLVREQAYPIGQSHWHRLPGTTSRTSDVVAPSTFAPKYMNVVLGRKDSA